MSVSESPCSSSKKLLTDHCSPLTDNCASAASSLLTATPEHPFYSVTRQAFIPVDQLSIGEKLLLSDGSEAIVEKLTLEKAPEGQSFSTYNFEVKDFHTYFVAPKNSPPDELAVWVHNTGNLCPEGQELLENVLKDLELDNDAFAPGLAKLISGGDKGEAVIGGMTFRNKSNQIQLLQVNSRRGNYKSWYNVGISRTKRLRNEFNSRVRKEYLKKFGRSAEAKMLNKKNIFTNKELKDLKKFGKLPEGWDVHHINPLYKGGTNDYTNLIPVRNKFHKRWNRLLHYYSDGFDPMDLVPLIHKYGQK